MWREIGAQALKRVLTIDPVHPRALWFVTDAASATGDWGAIVTVYQNALEVAAGRR